MYIENNRGSCFDMRCSAAVCFGLYSENSASEMAERGQPRLLDKKGKQVLLYGNTSDLKNPTRHRPTTNLFNHLRRNHKVAYDE